MGAGELDTKIRIEYKTDDQNTTGEPVPTWSLLSEVWAKRTDLRGREYFAAQANQSEITTKFKIYHLDGVREDMRIVCGDEIYDISEIIRIGRRQGLELMARANRG